MHFDWSTDRVAESLSTRASTLGTRDHPRCRTATALHGFESLLPTEHQSALWHSPFDNYVSGFPGCSNFTDLRLEMAFGAELPVESDDLNELPPPGADGSSDKVIRTKNYTRRGMEDIKR